MILLFSILSLLAANQRYVSGSELPLGGLNSATGGSAVRQQCVSRLNVLVWQGLVKLMEAAGLGPHINTMHALLNMYADARQPQAAELLFSRLQACGIQVTPFPALSTQTPPGLPLNANRAVKVCQ